MPGDTSAMVTTVCLKFQYSNQCVIRFNSTNFLFFSESTKLLGSSHLDPSENTP